MKNWMKNTAAFFVSLFFGLAILYLVVRDQDLSKIWGSIKEASPLWLVVSFFVIFLAYLTRVARWYNILLPVKKTKFRNLLNATIVGFMAVAILPLRVGEVIRPYLLARREKMSKSLTFATIIPVERLFDLSAILTFFAFYLVLVPTPTGAHAEQLEALAQLKKFSVILVAGILVAAVFFILLAFRSEKFLSITGKIFSVFGKKWGEKINKLLSSFVDGLTIIKSVKQFLIVYFWSLATWFIIGFAFWLVIVAFGHVIPIYHVFVLLFLTAAGAAVPVPAGIGPWHALCFVGVHYFFGIPETTAWGITFVSHIVGFALAVLIGPIFAMGEMRELVEIVRRGKSEKKPISTKV